MSTRRVGAEREQKTGRVHAFTIGDRLRKAREAAGYDQRSFEAASGISRATISAYELGKSKPRRAYLSIWANVTSTSLGWLLDGEEARSLSGTDSEDHGSATETQPVSVVNIGSGKNVPSPAPGGARGDAHKSVTSRTTGRGARIKTKGNPDDPARPDAGSSEA